jgi:hypothetical protein
VASPSTIDLVITILLMFLKIGSAISSRRDATIVEHYPDLWKKINFLLRQMHIFS